MPPRLAGRTVAVTGGGRGLGRAYSILLGRLGANVVVNDLGSAVDGAGRDGTAVEEVVSAIVSAGGQAVADAGDVSTWPGAEALVQRAVTTYGALDALVNNAGILRPRTIVGMTEAEWDDVIRVHMRGTLATTHFAAVHWRSRYKRDGRPVAGRVVNTSSGSGLYGNGQANYAAAKAAIAAMTLIAADELAHYGVTVNAIAPTARTRMAIDAIPDHFGPDAVAPLVAWLVSAEAGGVNGQVFNVGGGHVSVVNGWHTGPAADREEPWTVDELDSIVPKLVDGASGRADMLGYYPGEERSPLLPDLRYDRPDPKP
ncbi:MAG TPA: SDR family NAD(P)-dependent oxidoreductase [Acidimicrobiales bacterium]|jgi:NAD(P)-dependent dehydrogenase (short-subunit alcohol dehydrogenase family)|nr:SDR family NAD(P)-dependent oxidoreductase [Acidimicrobiales bacterium]